MFKNQKRFEVNNYTELYLNRSKLLKPKINSGDKSVQINKNILIRKKLKIHHFRKESTQLMNKIVFPQNKRFCLKSRFNIRIVVPTINYRNEPWQMVYTIKVILQK